MEKLTQEAEKTLRLSHFTIEKAPDVVFWVDSDARLHRVNQAICSYGYSPEDFVGKAFYELFPQMADFFKKVFGCLSVQEF